VGLTAAVSLDRTVLLIGSDLLNGRLGADEILEGLISTTARIVATEEQLAVPAAQHALVTLALQLAMCGIGIDLDVPDVALVAPQPPLGGHAFARAITDHMRATSPWVELNRGRQPDVTFVIGEGPVASPADVIVAGAATRVRVGPAELVRPAPWAGRLADRADRRGHRRCHGRHPHRRPTRH
jgi:hypothetical protein